MRPRQRCSRTADGRSGEMVEPTRLRQRWSRTADAYSDEMDELMRPRQRYSRTADAHPEMDEPMNSRQRCLIDLVVCLPCAMAHTLVSTWLLVGHLTAFPNGWPTRSLKPEWTNITNNYDNNNYSNKYVTATLSRLYYKSYYCPFTSMLELWLLLEYKQTDLVYTHSHLGLHVLIQ